MTTIDQMQKFRSIVDGEKSLHQQILEAFEDQHREYKNIYLEWYSHGNKLTESAITQDQIQQLFAAIDAGVRAGKNVDAPAAADGTAATTTPDGTIPKTGILGSISNSWLKFKDKIAQSAPVSGFDVAFDNLQGKVLAKAGGQQGAIGKALQKYKDFATKYPKMQGAIFAGISILAGISGWGLGGAALLMGIRTLDRLLQGDRFSSALWKGFKTGAISAVAGALGGGDTGGGDGGPEYEPAPAPTDITSGSYTVQSGDTLSDIAARNNTSVKELLAANPDITNPDVLKVGQNIDLSPAGSGNAVYQNGVGTASDTMAKIGSGQYADSPISRAAAARAGLKETLDYNKIRNTWKIQAEFKLPMRSKVYVTPYGVSKIFESCARQYHLNEGILSGIKNSIKAGIDTAKQGITKDKLALFWKKNYRDYSQAESVDTATVMDFLRRMGVKDSLIKSTFDELKIPTSDITPTNAPAGVAEPAAAPAATDPAATDPAAAPAAAPAATDPAAAPAAAEPATAAAPTATEPKVGQEIEFPGTNYKFKYTPQWITADGNVASEASANVLTQLASGVKNADIPARDLIAARRQIYKGAAGMTEHKRKLNKRKI